MQSVVGKRAEAVEVVLADLFARHGAPLVIKLNNGSGFVARRDLAAAVTFTGVMPQIDDALRERFLDTVAEQLAIAAAVQGLVMARVSQDHLRRSLGRVAVRRALQLCHIISIEGRRYHQWLPPHAARQEDKVYIRKVGWPSRLGGGRS